MDQGFIPCGTHSLEDVSITEAHVHGLQLHYLAGNLGLEQQLDALVGLDVENQSVGR